MSLSKTLMLLSATGSPRLLARVLFFFGVVFIFSFTYFYHGPISFLSEGGIRHLPPLPRQQAAFWSALQPILQSNSPNCPRLERNGTSGPIGYNATTPAPRPNMVVLPDLSLEAMSRAHEGFVRAIKSHPGLQLVYNPGTRGIVSAADGKYLPVFVS